MKDKTCKGHCHFVEWITICSASSLEHDTWVSLNFARHFASHFYYGQSLFLLFSNCSFIHPAPLSRNAKAATVTKLCSKFQFLGKFLARAIMDFRILDIPFCQILYKWLLNQQGTLDLGDLAVVDPVLAQSLTQLQQVVQRKRQLELDTSHTADSRQLAVDSLTLDGTPIEDLGLSFALPGHPDIELKVNNKTRVLSVSVKSKWSFYTKRETKFYKTK